MLNVKEIQILIDVLEQSQDNIRSLTYDCDYLFEKYTERGFLLEKLKLLIEKSYQMK